MSIHYCFLGSDEIFRSGFVGMLQREGFESLGPFDDLSEIEEAGLIADFLAVIDFPTAEFQFEAIRAFKSIYPSSSVVVLSRAFDLKSMIRCFELGAIGYVIRSLKPSALIASLHLAALGEKVLPSHLADVLELAAIHLPPAAETKGTADSASLSARERDVLSCLMAGFSNKVIARQLDLCEATVKVHVKAILRKLHVLNRTQAAIWASSHGIRRSPVLS